MADLFSVPYLKAEALIAVIKREDERDMARPLLSLFRRVQYASGKLKVRRLNRKPGRVLHSSFGGRAKPVRRGTWEETLYEPSVVKLFDTLTAEDLILFAEAERAMGANDVGMMGRAVLQQANDRIIEIGQNLRSDDAEERHALMAGALQGSITYSTDGGPSGVITNTVNYGLTALTAPSTDWDDAGATIVQDIAGWIQEFKDNNDRGLAPTHIVYNPEMWKDYFLTNTEMQTWKKNDPQLVRGFLRMQGGVIEADTEGRITQPIFGLQWLPIQGSYTSVAGVSTKRWAQDKLTLLHLDGADLRWGMSFDPLQNPEADVNIEISQPQQGDDVKAVKVLLFDNGLPIINDPQLVQTVDVVA